MTSICFQLKKKQSHIPTATASHLSGLRRGANSLPRKPVHVFCSDKAVSYEHLISLPCSFIKFVPIIEYLTFHAM
jgi:hypothetical protein